MVTLTKTQKLVIIIAISSTFFVTELSIGFYTKSLALIADAFHYLNDLIGFVVALVAFQVSQRSDWPRELSYGYQRATLLGAFFNGVFLLALGVSIFLQAIERFISLHHVDEPKLILITGCVGFALNIISATILHEHDHESHSALDVPATQASALAHLKTQHDSHRHSKNKIESKKEHDLGVSGVLLHVLGDAANNVGVIIAGIIIWLMKSPKRYYADPAVSAAISLMILLSAVPIIRRSGYILLDSVPHNVDPSDVKHDIEKVPGVVAVHELHIRRLNQQKAVASAHIVVSENELSSFMKIASTVNECFHAYGIHSVTLQPEAVRVEVALDSPDDARHGSLSLYSQRRRSSDLSCKLGCKTTACELPTCCD